MPETYILYSRAPSKVLHELRKAQPARDRCLATCCSATRGHGGHLQGQLRQRLVSASHMGVNSAFDRSGLRRLLSRDTQHSDCCQHQVFKELFDYTVAPTVVCKTSLLKHEACWQNTYQLVPGMTAHKPSNCLVQNGRQKVLPGFSVQHRALSVFHFDMTTARPLCRAMEHMLQWVFFHKHVHTPSMHVHQIFQKCLLDCCECILAIAVDAVSQSATLLQKKMIMTRLQAGCQSLQRGGAGKGQKIGADWAHKQTLFPWSLAWVSNPMSATCLKVCLCELNCSLPRDAHVRFLEGSWLHWLCIKLADKETASRV